MTDKPTACLGNLAMNIPAKDAAYYEYLAVFARKMN
jgi:hypothetical protein